MFFMTSYNKAIGDLGEELAVKYLEESGYKINHKNFRCRCGEIDIIGTNDNIIAFIEVKTRYCYTYGSPMEAINYMKIQKIQKTAQFYILKNKLFYHNFRFDIIEILLSKTNDKISINLVKNAF
jgi:putative endonuclease